MRHLSRRAAPLRWRLRLARCARRLGPLRARLDVRIVLVFVGLLLLVQGASHVTINRAIERNATAQVTGDLRTGERILHELLEHNGQNLTDASRLLAADYGFRSAVTTNDAATLIDALSNQVNRIGATAAIYTDARFQPVASTEDDPSDFLALVQGAASSGMPQTQAATVRVLNNTPFQMVTVDVRAPELIGHVSMGFPLNQKLVLNMEKLSSLKMALLTRSRGQPWHMLPIGPTAHQFEGHTETLRADVADPTIELDGENFKARLVVLGSGGSVDVAAVLLRSVDEAAAPYRKLQTSLLVIASLGVLFFALGSVVVAQRVTGPLKTLSTRAEQLGAGDYDAPVRVNSCDEIGQLAGSFEAMRVAMQQRESQIRRLAYWDALTGLPNAVQFRDRLTERIAMAQRDGTSCAVLILDLDRFKHVNDVLGHAFGDRLLQQIGGRLMAGALRDHDLVARLGGDEYAVCLPQADADTAAAIAQRLRVALEAPMSLDEHTVDVSGSVGIAAYPAHGADAETILGRAEIAMYAAKSKQAGVVVYTASLDTSSAESLSLLSELRTALDEGQFRLYLQPKLALDSGRIVGAEALVRWQHPTRGMVSPMDFIPFAEQTGFIRQITHWMLERCAVRQRRLRALGIDMKIAVNLSTRDLLDQDLPVRIAELMSRESVEPGTLCLEITESAIMDDPLRAQGTLERLHAMGLRLSIDDFGTGYSSLAYLKRLPVHELKIDKSFVMAMESDRADLKIVRSTIDLAHNLGLRVVAEGVENGPTWGLLRALGCDEAQGYYMSRPVPEAEFAAWAGGWRVPDVPLRTEYAALL